jgi:RNA polymerase sigma factor (sigma-70 family)
VQNYQALTSPDSRAHAANDIYERHLPLVRKTLAKCCGPRLCFAGGCPVEDLIGESYSSFRTALNDYEPARGVDFLGFVSQRLYWDMGHSMRKRQRPTAQLLPVSEPAGWPGEVQDQLLDGVFADEIRALLEDDEAELIRLRYGDGYSGAEIASRMGLSHSAVRKRLERVRNKLRALLRPARG